MKLSIPEFQLGKDKSNKYALQVCKEIGLPVRTKNLLTQEIKLNFDSKDVLINLPDEVDYIRKNGKAKILQSILDSKDRFLNTPTSIGINSDGGSLRINMTSTYGNHTTEVEFPGYIEAPEVSFSDDISAYRRQVVSAFNNDNLSKFSRAYRGYLQSCVSLVDCFLHRYMFHINTMVPSTKKYENTAILGSRSSIEDRLDAWITTFAANSTDKFKESKHRSKFLELKDRRNLIVHPVHPTIGYGAKDIVRYLNYAQEGVGGLLAELRKFSGETENIGFIQQVKNQAKVSIIKNA